MENKTIKDGNGNDIVVHAFQGKNDIRTYTAEELDVIRETTNQSNLACSLKAAAFGYTQSVLETIKTDTEFRERVVENYMLWLKQQLFGFVLCPGLAYRPEQALQTVEQVFFDSNGNEARLTINQYTTNCLKASEYLTKNAFEVDLALYVAANMDPAAKNGIQL